MDEQKKMRASCFRCRTGFTKPFGSPQNLCIDCGGMSKSCPTHGWYTIAPGISNDNCRKCYPMMTHKPKHGPAKSPTNVGDPLKKGR